MLKSTQYDTESLRVEECSLLFAIGHCLLCPLAHAKRFYDQSAPLSPRACASRSPEGEHGSEYESL